MTVGLIFSFTFNKKFSRGCTRTHADFNFIDLIREISVNPRLNFPTCNKKKPVVEMHDRPFSFREKFLQTVVALQRKFVDSLTDLAVITNPFVLKRRKTDFGGLSLSPMHASNEPSKLFRAGYS
jgi:hypothetical protein